MVKNEPRLESGAHFGLHPVEEPVETRDKKTDERDHEKTPSIRLPSKKGLRVIADLEAELRRNGLNPDLVDPNVVLLPKRFFLFPRVHPDDDEHRYMRRVRARSGVLTMLLATFLLVAIAALLSMLYTANELYLAPKEQLAHQRLLGAEFQEIVDNTDLAIDPVDPQLPEWLWTSFSPDWYIEDAIYARALDQSDRDIEMLSFLREKKAILVREIEPAYSNDKIQNRLRDPDIIYFGSEYERAYRRYVNFLLAVSLIAREDNLTPGLDSIFTTKRRGELIERITLPKPPEPNAYYDNRVEALVGELSSQREIIGDEPALISEEESEREKFLGMLDDMYGEIGEPAFQKLSDGGLGPLLKQLPYGWGSTNLTRAFYEAKRQRFINWNTLELRLLMLDLIFGAERLPQELPLVHLYLYHLGGEGYQQRFAEIYDQGTIDAAVEWVTSDIEQENSLATREQRFIEAFIDNDELKLAGDDEPNARRVALSLIYKAARFEHAYDLVEAADDDLEARPFLGKMGLPVASFDVDDIKPWGLFNARRNGYSHEGLDIGGPLGEPVLAVMDGKIIRAGYQRGGAGNYLVLAEGNLQVTYMHLLREPTRSNFKQLLTREELAAIGNDSRQGYETALRRYASIILDKSMDSLTDRDLDLSYLRENSTFDRAMTSIRQGKNPIVRKGEQIANIGLSGNVTQNSARPEMIYPHVHLEVNDGRIDPMQVIEGIGTRWYEIRDHHLNHPFYRNWLKQSHNWSWYSKFYPSGATVEDTPG